MSENLPPGCTDSDIEPDTNIERQANGSCESCGRALGAWNDGDELCHRCSMEEAKADEI